VFQQRQTEEFRRALESSWSATQEFWRHLVVVEAAVLGLTVGLLGGRDESHSLLLILSWAFLLAAIAVGSVPIMR
jgi:hypothetical protein